MSAGSSAPGPRPLTRGAAQALLALYPRAWRERYRREVHDLLADHCVSTRTLLDLIFGAIDARLHPELLTCKEPTMTGCIRAGQFVVACAAALYAIAVLSLQQIRDPQAAWLRAAAAHPQLRAGLVGVQITGGLAVTAGIAGLLLVITATIRQATSAGPGSLRRLAIQAAAVVVPWLGITTATVAVTSSRPGTGTRPLRTLDVALEYAWLASTATAVLLGAIVLWRALATADVTDAIVRPVRIIAAAAGAAMIAALAATITEASMLRTYAPALIGAGWLTAIAIAMLAATIMTGLALLHMSSHRPAPAQPA